MRLSMSYLIVGWMDTLGRVRFFPNPIINDIFLKSSETCINNILSRNSKKNVLKPSLAHTSNSISWNFAWWPILLDSFNLILMSDFTMSTHIQFQSTQWQISHNDASLFAMTVEKNHIRWSTSVSNYIYKFIRIIIIAVAMWWRWRWRGRRPNLFFDKIHQLFICSLKLIKILSLQINRTTAFAIKISVWLATDDSMNFISLSQLIDMLWNRYASHDMPSN